MLCIVFQPSRQMFPRPTLKNLGICLQKYAHMKSDGPKPYYAKPLWWVGKNSDSLEHATVDFVLQV